MKPVRCAVDPVFRANHGTADTEPLRKISRDAKLFAPHVLVVDDEPLIRWSVIESLSDLGFDVDEATDANSALRIMTTTSLPYDVVVLDLRLPDMDDLSLLGTLRHLYPRTKLILMTAFGTPEVLSSATAMGASVITKPFELDELRRMVLSGSHID